jgi:hypothetical protein
MVTRPRKTLTGKDRHLVSLFNDLRSNHHGATRAAREMTCLRCQKTGHMARDCDQERVPMCRRCQENGDNERARGHTAANCEHYDRPPRCHECREIGHRRANCPLVTYATCDSLGHSAAACTTPQTCHRCHQPGHTQKDCNTVLSRAFLREQRGENRDVDNNKDITTLWISTTIGISTARESSGYQNCPESNGSGEFSSYGHGGISR